MQKGIWQNAIPLLGKSIGEIGYSRPTPKHNKAIYNEPTTNIKLDGNTLEAIPLKSGTRQGCPLSSYLFNIVLKVLARAIRQQQQQQQQQQQ